MPSRKNILKKLYYNTLWIEEVNFLPPRCDGDLIFTPQFVFHPLIQMPNPWTAWTNAMTPILDQDLDHQYHQWHGPFFCSFTYVRRLQCQNPRCDYLQRAQWTSLVNDINFDGFTKEPFPISGPLPLGCTPMCRLYKEPPNSIAPCYAKILYIHGNDTIQRACIHLGNHHPCIKVGNCRDRRPHWGARRANAPSHS